MTDEEIRALPPDERLAALRERERVEAARQKKERERQRRVKVTGISWVNTTNNDPRTDTTEYDA